MEGLEGKIVYFEKVGRENTETTLSIAKARAEELGIQTIVVASTYGDTAARAVEVFEGFRVIVVSHVTGHRDPDTHEFTAENRQKVESKGVPILSAAHAFTGGVNVAMRRKFNMYLLGDVIASVLRIFGQGMKVVCEVALMAADAGLVRTDENVIVISGSGRGADTAVVLKPVNSINFFDLKIQEILCKPHLAVTRERQEVAATGHHHP
ncbi:MAG: hypothetical protein HY325_00895 [Chloroflexi bacterium]|nr:hypothetical protein [Chloroflexota bacterium]